MKRQFDPGVRSRGEQYARERRVSLEVADPSIVVAAVSGTHEYTVLVRRDPGELAVCCSCPYFTKYGPCKHIYATLIEADRAGRMRSPPGLKLVPTHIDQSDDDEGVDDRDWPGGGAPSDEVEHGRTGPAPPRATTGWRQVLVEMAAVSEDLKEHHDAHRARTGKVFYAIHAQRSIDQGALSVVILKRSGGRRGSLMEWRSFRPGSYSEERFGEDAAILSMLDAADRDVARRQGSGYRYGYVYGGSDAGPLRRIMGSAYDIVIPTLVRTGRCLLVVKGDDYEAARPLRLDADTPWRFKMRLSATAKGAYRLSGAFERDGRTIDAREPAVTFADGWMFLEDVATRYGPRESFGALAALRGRGEVDIPAARIDDFLEEYHSSPARPRLECPDECAVTETHGTPRPVVRIGEPDGRPRARLLEVRLGFEYDGVRIEQDDRREKLYVPERRLVRRDPGAEEAARDTLFELGACFPGARYRREGATHTLAVSAFPKAVRELVAREWIVEADGVPYRSASGVDVKVVSGIDWFDVEGVAAFEGVTIGLPGILKALRAGHNVVRLGDGSFGVLPEDWLKRWGALARLGEEAEGGARFSRAQAGMLDALLADLPDVQCDEAFARLRGKLSEFAGVKARPAPRGFKGTLRPYQRDGLGWISFLEEFRFGGCLADDMGLGKTVQTLAALERRRTTRARGERQGAADRIGPSLVVAPRSVVYNWRQEAERFTPRMRVIEHTGTGRARDCATFADADLVLTTYGTMRRDILAMKEIAFDYVILDEAQAIKNARTNTAKAARLLSARHRLALSGTPIENHIGELWSLFEFLNPGMLGASKLFSSAASRSQLDESTRRVIAAALKPFILRRTKEQVAPDLPPKSEETVWCELEGDQRRQYEKLRTFYRASLLGADVDDSAGKYKLQVLEALLRLRQAACHAALVSRNDKRASSAKFESLLPQLKEIMAEGHKALVFSQFTSLLALLREELDARSIRYEYLDGRTRKRAERVERFQADDGPPLFLISLKAGGLGLNLTAADYVFLLDPWWNPAVDAQAIDRTHRIGQTKSVFAYRLVARDTVEEKIIALQNAKRELADAIIGGDKGVIGALTRDDLAMLLS